MTNITELWVNRGDYRETKIIESPASPLNENEVLVRIDKFGLTANNVSYAVSGDMIGYWKYYPADDPFGKVPVWGMADVVESNNDDIAVGERLWGFFPMASHATLTVGKVYDDNFMDATPHRLELPALYNQYRRTKGEPEFLHGLEDERCLLFPLFMTSFVLYDYLIDNDFFGAKQVLIGSVSSKTGFGLAKFLHDDKRIQQKIVGVTSAGNVGFVERLDCCDQIITYGDEGEIDSSQPAAYVDMSGNGPLTEKLHLHLDGNMVESCMVGATHWEEERRTEKSLPGARPTFFFAPKQIAKRDKEWGAGTLFVKAGMASARVADNIKNEINVERISGAESAATIWKEMLNNKVSPNRGIMVGLN